MKTVFSNKYGTLVLEPISEVKKISELGRVKDVPEEHLFTMDEAEKIVLITGNDGVQIAMEYPMTGRASVIIHETGSTGAWAKIVKLEFADSVNATQELASLVSRGPIVL